MPGGGQEPLGLGRVVAIVLRALAEPRDGQRPVGKRGGQGPVHRPDAFEGRIDHALAVDGKRDGLAHTDIVERRLIGAHVDEVHHVRGKLRDPEGGPALLHGAIHGCQQPFPVHRFERVVIY